MGDLDDNDALVVFTHTMWLGAVAKSEFCPLGKNLIATRHALQNSSSIILRKHPPESGGSGATPTLRVLFPSDQSKSGPIKRSTGSPGRWLGAAAMHCHAPGG